MLISRYTMVLLLAVLS